MKESNDVSQINDIQSFFLSNKCKVTKYNHCIDLSNQKETQLEGYIQLNADDEMMIMLKKSNERAREYILEADPRLIQIQLEKYQKNKQEAMFEYLIQNTNFKVGSLNEMTTTQPAETYATTNPTETNRFQEDIENED